MNTGCIGTNQSRHLIKWHYNTRISLLYLQALRVTRHHKHTDMMENRRHSWCSQGRKGDIWKCPKIYTLWRKRWRQSIIRSTQRAPLDCYKQVHVSKDISLYNSISNEHWIEIWNSYFFILLLMRNCDCPNFVFVLLWFVALQTFTNISLIHFYFYGKTWCYKEVRKVLVNHRPG